MSRPIVEPEIKTDLDYLSDSVETRPSCVMISASSVGGNVSLMTSVLQKSGIEAVKSADFTLPIKTEKV